MMSTSVGIDNGGGIHNDKTIFQSTGVKGVTSADPKSVMLGNVDLTKSQSWLHMVGSAGEASAVYSPAGAAKVTWTAVTGETADPMTWLTTEFDAPQEVLTPTPFAELKATL